MTTQSAAQVELPPRVTTESFQISIQEDTNRVKGKKFDAVTTDPDEIIRDVFNLWAIGTAIFTNPLVQARHVYPLEQETSLLEAVAERNEMLPDAQQIRINGRIPFVDPHTGERLAIYYTSMEDPNRSQFHQTEQMDHNTALRTAEAKGPSEIRPLLDGIEIRVISEYKGQIYDYLGDGILEELDAETAATQLAELHKQTFAHAHDISQTKPAGQSEILRENPVVIAIDTNSNQIVAAGLMEEDFVFNFDIALTEPTFYTAAAYRRMGISTHLRRTMQELIDMETYFARENRNTIIFNESIRASSFIGSLRAGCALSGDLNATQPGNTINGNLGNAYTYIGPASPETGLMPMGLTHWTSSSIRLE